MLLADRLMVEVVQFPAVVEDRLLLHHLGRTIDMFDGSHHFLSLILFLPRHRIAIPRLGSLLDELFLSHIQ